jgi:DNA recombination protein RmuC
MLDYFILGALVVLIVLVVFLLINLSKNKPLPPDLTGFLSSQADLKVHLQKEYAEFRYQLAQMINDTGKTSQKDLNEFKETMIRQIELKFKDINDKVDLRLGEGFDKTNKTFTDVVERLTKIDEAQKKIELLSTEVVSLNDLLKGQKTRGIFGEVQLYQLLVNVFGEKTTLYDRQHRLSNNAIADAVIFAPEPMGMVAVDSKFPLENYKRMLNKDLGDADRLSANKDFKRDVKKHIDDIKNKYILAGETSDHAVMFVPAEAVFAEIYANHDDIIDYANQNKVWVTSPTTLIYMLSMIQIIIINIEKNKQTGKIIDELKGLGEDFKRYSERWEKLKRSIDSVSSSAKDVHVTTTKISKKFEHISQAKFDEIEEDDLDQIDQPEIEELD